MKAITFKAPDDLVDHLEACADAEYNGNMSDCIREELRKADRVDELERERNRLEARLDDLRNQLATVRSREDDVDELADEVTALVARERTRETIERRRREASAIQRVKWWFTGMPLDELDDAE